MLVTVILQREELNFKRRTTYKLVRFELSIGGPSPTPYDTQHKCHIALELRYGPCEKDVIIYQDIEACGFQAQLGLVCLSQVHI